MNGYFFSAQQFKKTLGRGIHIGIGIVLVAEFTLEQSFIEIAEAEEFFLRMPHQVPGGLHGAVAGVLLNDVLHTRPVIFRACQVKVQLNEMADYNRVEGDQVRGQQFHYFASGFTVPVKKFAGDAMYLDRFRGNREIRVADIVIFQLDQTALYSVNGP